MNFISSNVLLTFVIASCFQNVFSSGIDGSFLEYALEYSKQDISTLLNPVVFTRTIDIDEEFVKLVLAINAKAEGLSDYKLYRASLTPDLRTMLEINLYNALISGNYNLKGTYYKIIPLIGEGNFNIKFRNLYLYLDTRIVPANGTIQLPYFDFKYDYDELSVSVEGLTGQDDVGAVLQYFLKDFISNTLKKKEKEITSFIKTYTMTKGNEYLKTATISSFIQLIKVLFVY